MQQAPTEPTLPPVVRTPFAAPKSMFEQATLPGFARWFADQVRKHRPDLFLPVETKGARLLDEAMAYARDTLGEPLRVPVLYTPALAYEDRDNLARLRVMLLDDASNSGDTLRRHVARVMSYGVKAENITITACIVAGERGKDQPRTDDDPRPEAFRTVDPDGYRDYLWQLADMVVSRGLPPEVDHHVFRLSMRDSLLDNWATLIDRLARLGQLSVDGAVTTSADVVSMTLHFPVFPGTPPYPVDGPVRDEGVRKLRLFADMSNDTIQVVPMAFPALDLGHTDVDDDLRVSKGRCHELVSGWTGDRATIADVLLDHAQAPDAELLFRVISTATEFDLVEGFAAFLGRDLEDGTIAMVADRDLFARLYGQTAGELAADEIDARIATAFARGRSEPVAPGRPRSRVASLASMGSDPRIPRTTRALVGYLKHYAEEAKLRPDHDPLRRVGLSVSELERGALPEPIDSLHVSRCIDYGLSMTTLVPFTDVERRADGTVKVRRRYRVSEATQSGDAYEDADIRHDQLQQEVVALLARTLSRRSERWKDAPIPPNVMASVVAILNPVVLDAYSVGITIVSSLSGPELRLGNRMEPETLFSVTSESFRVEGSGVVPTTRFTKDYEDKRLRLDRRDRITPRIESAVKTLLPALDHAEHVDELLRAWAQGSSSRRGLDAVSHFLSVAVKQLQRPVTLLSAGSPMTVKDVIDACDRASEHHDAAVWTIDMLTTDHGEAVRALWPDPDRTEEPLLRGLTSPARPTSLLDVARHTCGLLEEAIALLRRVEAWADDTDKAPADDGGALAAEVSDAVAALRRHATTFQQDGAADGLSKHQSPAEFAADRLTEALGLLRTRAAAVAWTYTGEVRGLRESGELSARLATVLAVDLAGSTPNSVGRPPADNRRWVTTGLELAVQWGRAFGGVEIPGRRGDETLIEFEHADSAVLCAAVVQEHGAALEALGDPDIAWGFRAAVATGEIGDEAGSNTVGSPLNIASKLLKHDKGDEGSTGRVLLTEMAADACSSSVRENLIEVLGETIDLDPDYTSGIGAERMRITPRRVASRQAVELFVGADDVGVPAQLAS